MKMRVFIYTLLMMLALATAPQQMYAGIADTLPLSVVADGTCARLSWNSVPEAADSGYRISLRYPNIDTFSFAALTADTTLLYCLPRQVCGDTVLFVVSVRGADSLHSNAVGEQFNDNSPTSPCTIDCATIDSLSQQVLLRWHPSPDKDIMGYYICSGSPCMDLDTVWGADNTSYICAQHSSLDSNCYRILAFDSCMRASQLTPYFGNLLLQVTMDTCSRRIHAWWNEYRNMPNGLQHYLFSIHNDTMLLRTDTIGATAARYIDIEAADSMSHIVVSVSAVSNDGVGIATSNRIVIDLMAIDTPRYMRIVHCDYDMEENGVLIEGEVDSLFTGATYTLYRTADAEPPQPLATLTPTPQGTIRYLDRTINLQVANNYRYHISTTDRCHLRQVNSNALIANIPSTATRGAIFPNVIIPSGLDNTLFCPSLRFVDAQHYQMNIYNRTGQQVYETDDPRQCWDARHQGRVVPTGTYVYVVRCRYIDGSLDMFRGTVLVIE